jgi:hypothetical protein
MENNRFTTFQIIWFSIIGIFVVVVVGLLVFININTQDSIMENPSDTIFPTAVPLGYSSADVTAVSPSYSSLLTPGEKEIFTVSFSTSVQEKTLKILLSKKKYDDTSESIVSVPIATELLDKGKSLLISMQEEVEIYHEYSLTIIDGNNKTLTSTTYLTSNVVISRAPSNNPTLQQYLPHETASYILSYNERRNTYIFNFKVDPSSTLGFSEQFESAKQQAEEFIQSRGIDINSIVIEWRHS